MLNAKINTTLFGINLQNNASAQNNALILSGCKVTLVESKPYSELEEMNCCYLNSNDFACGSVAVELYFDNILYKNPYVKFFVNCISIRTDKGVLCKLNVNPSPYEENYTKITKDGKLSIGIGYFFRTVEEKKALNSCNSFCIEGFVALKKKKNVFGFVCCVQKAPKNEQKPTENDWVLTDGNTYKIYKKANIYGLHH